MVDSSVPLRLVLGVNALSLAALLVLAGVLAFRPAPQRGASSALARDIQPATAPKALSQQEQRPGETTPPPSPDPELFSAAAYDLQQIEDEELRARVALGKRLISETYALIGPNVADESQRYAGNELACKNCHLDAGLKPYAASYVGVTSRFPNFRNRENKVGTIEERVNGCMERSMNGKPLPADSAEMTAIVAYMKWLSHLAQEDGGVKGKGFLPANYPNRAADPERGKQVYGGLCSACHGVDGKGQRLPSGVGYLFPPLAGADTYNDGAGMHRVLTAMAFIKGNMPLGATYRAPVLSDDDAYDVAAYINTFERPQKHDKEADFPNRKLKPMSTPYPPYADPFSPEQHKMGPFAPIFDYYLAEHDLKKNK